MRLVYATWASMRLDWGAEGFSCAASCAAYSQPCVWWMLTPTGGAIGRIAYRYLMENRRPRCKHHGFLEMGGRRETRERSRALFVHGAGQIVAMDSQPLGLHWPPPRGCRARRMHLWTSDDSKHARSQVQLDSRCSLSRLHLRLSSASVLPDLVVKLRD